MRNVWCMRLEQKGIQAAAEKAGYKRAEAGEDKKPGTFGGGFSGETVICLRDDDSGKWFALWNVNCDGRNCRHLPKEKSNES